MPEEWELYPNLSSEVAQQGLADEAGGIAYSGISDSSTAGEIAFQGPTADFILYGVVNGAFAQGPADTAANIEPVNNPLPYWYGPVQVSGGAVTASWATDATYPSGQALRFTFNPGAASDEAYFEQIVPVGGGYLRRFADYIRISYVSVSNTNTGFGVKVALQYLTASGATTGASGSGALTLASSVGLNMWAPGSVQAPADATYLRIRIGVTRNTAGASDSAVIDIPDVRRDIARGTVVLAEQLAPDTYNFGRISQINGVMSLVPFQSNGTVSLSVSQPGAYTRMNGGHYQTPEIAAPSTPDSGYYAIYAKTDGKLYGKNDGGTETELGGGGSLSPLILAETVTDTISANQNDYSPTGLETCNNLVLTPSGANRNITGFDATGFVEGQRFTVMTASGTGLSIVLVNGSASSTAGNRIAGPNAANVTLLQGSGVDIIYSPALGALAPFRIVAGH